MPKWVKSNIHEGAYDLLESDISGTVLSIVESIIDPLDMPKEHEYNLMIESRTAAKRILNHVHFDVDSDIANKLIEARDTMSRARSFMKAIVEAYNINAEDTKIKQNCNGEVASEVTLAELIDDLEKVSGSMREIVDEIIQG